jgi:hypothetical protein
MNRTQQMAEDAGFDFLLVPTGGYLLPAITLHSWYI